MNSIVLHSTSGPDCKLHLEVPVDAPNTEFEVEVVVRPKNATRAFPAGYWDLIGSVDDETFIIHAQPPLSLQRPVNFDK